MKKTTKNVLIWGGLIALVAVIYLLFVSVQQTAFQSMPEVQCVGTGTVQSCHSYGTSNAYTSASNGQVTLTLTATDLHASEIAAWRQANSTVDSFFSQAHECQFAAAVTFKEYDQIPQNPAYNSIASYHASCSGGYYGTRTPSNPDGYYPSVPKQCAACSGSYYEYGLGTYGGLTEAQAFPNQLMVVSGTASTADGRISGVPFTTYGFCNAGQCKLQIPAAFVNVSGSGSEYQLSPTSWNLYIKYGGYNTSNICVQDGLETCNGQHLQTCSGFSFVDNGLVPGKCGYQMPGQNLSTQPVQNPIVLAANLTQAVQQTQNSSVTQTQQNIINQIASDGAANSSELQQLAQTVTAQNPNVTFSSAYQAVSQASQPTSSSITWLIAAGAVIALILFVVIIFGHRRKKRR